MIKLSSAENRGGDCLGPKRGAREPLEKLIDRSHSAVRARKFTRYLYLRTKLMYNPNTSANIST